MVCVKILSGLYSWIRVSIFFKNDSFLINALIFPSSMPRKTTSWTFINFPTFFDSSIRVVLKISFCTKGSDCSPEEKITVMILFPSLAYLNRVPPIPMSSSSGCATIHRIVSCFMLPQKSLVFLLMELKVFFLDVQGQSHNFSKIEKLNGDYYLFCAALHFHIFLL